MPTPPAHRTRSTRRTTDPPSLSHINDGAPRVRSDTRKCLLVDRGLRGREDAGDADEGAVADEVVLGAEQAGAGRRGVDTGRALLPRANGAANQ